MQTKIIKYILSIIILCSFRLAMANEISTKKDKNVRGSTHRFIDDKNLKVVGDAPTYTPPLLLKKTKLQKPLLPNAPMTESTALDLYLPAKSHLAIQFDHATQSLNLIFPESVNSFSETVQAAINKSPLWVQNDLKNVFSFLNSTYREKWANAILNAEDPYIDEIAFSIAHLSPQYLSSSYASEQLLLDNATLIYENDQVLDYVEVVDYGSSQTDPDYYSTTKYRRARLLDTLEVEVPRDIYYWYIVHPKISDEIPAYIDPDILESNYSHRNNITTADKGYFWRDFLFNYYDSGYSRLRDLLKGCKVVRNEFSESVVSQIDPAVEILSRWLSRSMIFTSNNERPHQPVRIYRKHIGRCGEHGDMRVAIGRAALIPVANVASYSTDHVWNEFWDLDWTHWDDDIDNPYVYLGSGWNKQFGTVFRWRSDGALESVTQRYTHDQSTIYVYALDKNETPIDGAKVYLYTSGNEGDLVFDMYAITNNEGRATFVVGTNRKYYARMVCDYGSVPSGGDENLMRVVSSSQADMAYSVSMTIDAEKPVTMCEEIEIPQFNNSQFLLNVDIKFPNQLVSGTDPFDDLESNAYVFVEQLKGRANLMIMDETNYQNFTEGNTYQGFHTFYETDSCAFGFEFDESSDWYCVIDNSNSFYTLQHLTGNVELYSVYDASIPKVAILPNYPNPVNSKKSDTIITYQLPQKSKVELTIYNILGQEVKKLMKETSYAGEFSINWDCRDNKDQFVPTGVYFIKIKTDLGEACRKMLVIH